MGITNIFALMGKTAPYAATASIPFLLASALSAQASTIDMSSAAFPISNTLQNTYDTMQSSHVDTIKSSMISTQSAWAALAPATMLPDTKFTNRITTIKDPAEEEQRRRIRATIHTTKQNKPGQLVYATIQPVGVKSDRSPMTFTHISGPIGLTDEIINGKTKRYVGAYIGIDTDAYVMEQVTKDPRGNHQVGQLVTTSAPDIKVSENARVAAMFTPEKGGIEELQISVGYTMLKDEDIVLTLFNADGKVVRTIDAKQFQIKETPDFLVMFIKNAPETLATIYDNMLADGTFSIEAQSPMGRKILSNFNFGLDFESKLNEGYARLPSPAYHFKEATQDFKRRIAYDPNSPAVGHELQNCIFLGLQNLSEEKLQETRVVLGEVTDGTAMPTRDFSALIALDKFNNVVAAGSKAWWGVNYETNTLRRSGSSDTRFLTNDGNVFSGCTDAKITTIVPPGTPIPPYGYIPGIPTGVETPDTPLPPSEQPPRTSVPVPAPFALILTGLAAMSLLPSRNSGNQRVPTHMNNAALSRREDEFESPSPSII